jgi:hypothetical protein
MRQCSIKSSMGPLKRIALTMIKPGGFSARNGVAVVGFAFGLTPADDALPLERALSLRHNRAAPFRRPVVKDVKHDPVTRLVELMSAGGV